MILRTLGSSDLTVSAVGLGTMSWPGTLFGVSDPAAASADLAPVRDMIRAAAEAGITFFDTAEGYGRGLAEDQLGRALEELGLREQSVIVTKVGPLFAEEKTGARGCNLSKTHILARCEASLRRLRTDRIDLYLAHWPDPETPLAETMEAAEILRREGKIRWFGVSNFSSDLLASALAHAPVVANQLPYSLADRSIDADQRPFCVENHVGIMAYSPLGKGVLSGKYDATHLPPGDDYRHQRKHFAKENLPRHLAIAARLRALAPECGCSPAQLAMAWALAQPGITVILPGAKTPDQVRANAAAADVRIPPEILTELNTLSASA
jgi:aryl-alcohol dehydrogenase-like predicted oxidoreductase